jgi:pyruvate-formate lyase
MNEQELQLTHERWEAVVMHRAIELYGVDKQIDQAEQEMIELLDALKHRQRPNRVANVCEEIADVEIMLDQLKLIFHVADAVANIRTQKLARLEKRMNGGIKYERAR